MGWQAFGSLAAGNQPLSLFDTLTSQISQTVVNPTTAAGTNAITLTLNANAGPVTAYNNFQQFSFVAAASSTGAVTIQVGVLAVMNLYKPGNIAAGAGDITSGVLYVIAFNQALNTGAGGFVIVSATPASVSLPITVANGGTGLTSLTTFAPLCGGTGITANVQQATTGFSTVGAVLTSQGASALPTWVAGGATGGNLVSVQTFTSSQTVTIPATATKGFFRLVGAGGGASTVAGCQTSTGAGAGYLEKYLTGLVAGNTLALTIGAGVNGSTGGSSILASGTQSITTLTASGGQVSGLTPPNTALGGTATNGDINVTGDDGQTVLVGEAWGGGTPLAGILSLTNVGSASIAGKLYGGGAVSNSGTTARPGGNGVCIIAWYT